MEILSILWQPSKEVFTIGSFSLHWYSFFWCVGLIAAYIIVYKLYKAQCIPQRQFDPLFFYCFIGILIEHYAGKFPTWLSPCQVKVLPVSEKTRAYADEVAAKLRDAGIRVKVDERDEKIGYKIREARSVDRVPYMLILGEKEAEAGNISVRDRSNETVQKSLDEFISEVKSEIVERR